LNDHDSVGSEVHIELEAVGSDIHAGIECLDRVLWAKRYAAAMGKDQRPVRLKKLHGSTLR
jgi:hypothetical protein